MNIGFLSTRFQGTDGVTLEAAKWAKVLEEDGHRALWFGGRLGTPPDVSFPCAKAFFDHPEIRSLQDRLFGVRRRERALTDAIHAVREELKDAIGAFVERFGIDLLIPQNILAIPMHVPLGLATSEFISESRLPVIAHHHDFSWERERFAINCVPEFLDAAFPPPFDHRCEHVVINSPAAAELARRRGLSSTVIPNVLDFGNPAPDQPDAFNADFRAEFGIAEDDVVVLQPTRVVPRKGIEHAIELVRRLRQVEPRRAFCLVVSHESGDEGHEYAALLEERAADAGVRMLFIGDRVAERRGADADGRKLYTLDDVYFHANLVTYPSTYEGFGNAFLEAVYFRKPILVNRYSIYIRDIEPLGFRCLSMDGIVTRSLVEQTRDLLASPERIREWTRHNEALARRHFSFDILRERLNLRLDALFGSQRRN